MPASDGSRAVAIRAVDLIATGTLDELRAAIHPDAVNAEAVNEPPAARGRGPEAFYATASWLRGAFSDLAFTVEASVHEGDLVVTYGTMAGRHTGPFTVWTPEAGIARVFVPTGRQFCVHQAHFQRLRDGLVIEHWAVRDDNGMALQLGWTPPSPWFLLRCNHATRRARRALAATPEGMVGSSSCRCRRSRL